jgi:hypothetical protein
MWTCMGIIIEVLALAGVVAAFTYIGLSLTLP